MYVLTFYTGREDLAAVLPHIGRDFDVVWP